MRNMKPSLQLNLQNNDVKQIPSMNEENTHAMGISITINVQLRYRTLVGTGWAEVVSELCGSGKVQVRWEM